MFSLIKAHPLIKIPNHALIDLPSPNAISGWWNFGSLLGLCLGTQLISGVFLAIFYSRYMPVAFECVREIEQIVNLGWLLRVIHANGASFFFFCLYFHAGRGIFYGSFSYSITWAIGVIILLITMAAAFLGYVLPWGQISFWGTSVITNLLSAIPYIGNDLVIWLWGDYAVGAPILTRFFAFHFILPFIISALAIVHLLFLHQTGSNNPLGISRNYNKISFQPYFSTKDLFGVFVLFICLRLILRLNPLLLGDPENFIIANPLVTPIHIQPEWYFLFAYAILRSIPNKLGGVIALAIAILILLGLILYPSFNLKRIRFYPIRKLYFWALVISVILLTWIGARPVEEPYILTGQILTIFYFSYYLFQIYLIKLWDHLILFNWKFIFNA